MNDDGLTPLQWRAGLGMVNPSFSGVRIVESDLMPTDQIAFLPNGEAVMGKEKCAALLKHVQSKMDEQIKDAIYGFNRALPQKPDPEIQAMQENELWGAF